MSIPSNQNHVHLYKHQRPILYVIFFHKDKISALIKTSKIYHLAIENIAQQMIFVQDNFPFSV